MVFVSWSSLSERVDLPWSTCAMIEKFLPEQAEVWFQSGTEGQSCQ